METKEKSSLIKVKKEFRMSTTGYLYQIGKWMVVIPSEGWMRNDELWTCVIACDDAREDTDVDIVLEKESIGVSLCGIAKAESGQVTLFAYTKPQEDIRATIRVTEVRA